MSRREWLLSCAALGAGEFVISTVANLFEFWPALLIAGALTAVLGFGFQLRGWHYVALFLLGASLFLAASEKSEEQYRERPWMRNARRYESQPENKVRRELSRRVGIGLEHDRAIASVNRAILLGERYRLPARLKRVFAESGTIHVFAISGLHVMAVAKVLMVMLAFLFVPRRIAGVFSIPLLWGYVWVIGMPPSAVRAAIMASFYFAAPIFWRRPDGIVSWALAFISVHIVSPHLVADVGNALSFSVMLAIMVVAEFVKNASAWRAQFAITAAAWAAGVPIAAHVFGRVTPGGILANLVLIYTAGLSVVTGMLGIVASFVSTTIAAHFNNLAALITKSMIAISELVARLPFANVEVGCWSYWQCAEWYLMLVLIAWLVWHVAERRKSI